MIPVTGRQLSGMVLRATIVAAAQRRTLLSLATVVLLTLATAGTCFAQNPWARGPAGSGAPNPWARGPAGSGTPNPWARGPAGSGTPNPWARGPSDKNAKGKENAYSLGSVTEAPGPFMVISAMVPRGLDYVDKGAIPDGIIDARRRLRSARYASSGVPPADEKRLVADEVLLEFTKSLSPHAIDVLQRRHRLTTLQSQHFELTGTTIYRCRFTGKRTVVAVVRKLEADAAVASAQPNYSFTLQQDHSNAGGKETSPEDNAPQYYAAKLHLQQAHALATGANILVAVIDSGIDVSHPDLHDAIDRTFDATDAPIAPDKHGTAIAGLIAGHGRLMGVAPGVRILAIQAFEPKGGSAVGSTFDILKALDWAAANDARVVNMGFGGPADPAIHRSLAAAHKKNIVLVAAAGNAGPKSPPLYPADDPNVIAVSATDAEDRLYPQSTRGRQIAIAAPGVGISVAVPGGGYEVASGTSYAAAEISGIVALMLDQKPELTPDKVRKVLQATARDVGPKGSDIMFGAGIADAYGAVTREEDLVTTPRPRSIKRFSARKKE